MEAALRTTYYLLTKKNLEKIDFKAVRGFDGIREAIVKINDLNLHVAIVDGMANAKKLLKDVEDKKSEYHFIEIMNWVGGCIGGGGQPKINLDQENAIKNKRVEGLYKRDNERTLKSSYENPDIKRIYAEFLEHPLSKKALELLHHEH